MRFSQRGPNWAKIGEGKMLKRLVGRRAHRKEWMAADSRAAIQKAMREIHKAQNRSQPLEPFYFPGSKLKGRSRAERLPDVEYAAESPTPPPPSPVPVFPAKRLEIRNPERRLKGGIMEKQTRSGLVRR